MKIQRLILGPVGTNCYIFCDENSGKAAVIDPAYDHKSIIKAVRANGCEVDKIILTHGHYDHIGGLSGMLAECPGALLYTHKRGVEVLADPSKTCCREIGGVTETFTPDETVTDGDVIPFGENGFEVIYTPGHTIDSMCLKMQDMIFCGDTVFRFSIGRTDLPTGSSTQIIESIKSKLMILDDSVQLYPGHGESTTVGEEKRNNPYLY